MICGQVFVGWLLILSWIWVLAEVFHHMYFLQLYSNLFSCYTLQFFVTTDFLLCSNGIILYSSWRALQRVSFSIFVTL